MNDWGKFGRAYENIAESLSKRSDIKRVICILPPRRVDPGAYSWPFEVSKVSSKLIVFAQKDRIVPLGGRPYRLRKWVNECIPYGCFRTLINWLGLERTNTLLWIFPPHRHIDWLIEEIPHGKRVVQIVDNNTFLEEKPVEYRSYAAKQYDALAGSADHVIVSSELNFSLFASKCRACSLFENAVDEMFLAQPSELPSRSTGSRPRAGYVGWITERTDIELLIYASEKLPRIEFLLAGPVGDNVEEEVQRLGALPNVTLLGPIAYRAVPDFLASLDVCLIPHKDSQYSRSMSPLKLFQYLGSGRPIVSTRVAGVGRWAEHVHIAENGEDFVKKIEKALVCETRARAEQRILAARQETWDVRVNEILEAIT